MFYTPIGKVPTSNHDEFCHLSGLKFLNSPDVPLSSYEFLSDEVMAWHMNKNDVRKANEANLIKSKIFIPIRSYNMEISLYKAEKELNEPQDLSKNVVPRAIEICRTMFQNGIPIYYPDKFLEEEKVTYGKILSRIRDERRDLYSWYFDKYHKAKKPTMTVMGVKIY